ncbi:MAG: hypothetical protein AVDCRST_MAG56-3970, partial [uncultured Cytophagales bacterium]
DSIAAAHPGPRARPGILRVSGWVAEGAFSAGHQLPGRPPDAVPPPARPPGRHRPAPHRCGGAAAHSARSHGADEAGPGRGFPDQKRTADGVAGVPQMAVAGAPHAPGPAGFPRPRDRAEQSRPRRCQRPLRNPFGLLPALHGHRHRPQPLGVPRRPLAQAGRLRVWEL